MLFYDIILKDIVNYRAVSKPITIWVFPPQTHGFPPKCLWYCWWTQVFHICPPKTQCFSPVTIIITIVFPTKTHGFHASKNHPGGNQNFGSSHGGR